MTYYELLSETQKKKEKAIREINKALKGKAGFLVKAEIERNPGSVAWCYLVKEFCEVLADHIGEWVEQFENEGDTITAIEISDIYMAYENGDPDLYYILPVEARLFE